MKPLLLPPRLTPPAGNSALVSPQAQRWRWLWRSSRCPEAPPSGETWSSSGSALPLTRSLLRAPSPSVPETPLLSLSPPSACHTRASPPLRPGLPGKHVRRINVGHLVVLRHGSSHGAGEPHLPWAGLLLRKGPCTRPPTFLKPGRTCGAPKKHSHD